MMGAAIHPSAVVEPGAELCDGVQVGPLAVIGGRVRLGPRCRVDAHAVVDGDTLLGADNRVGSHAVLGRAPQVRGLDGRAGTLRIGAGNVFRELCTVHAGRPDGETRIGDGNLLMVSCHVAHDCVLGDGIEMANAVQLAGHVQVGSHASLGGLAGVHQFVRIGPHSFVGAGAMVSQDVPPFSLVSGDRARVYGINAVGLRRNGFSRAQREQLGRALRSLLRAASLEEGLARMRRDLPAGPELDLLLDFARSSTRGLCRMVGGEKR